jgi:hypothetical protein
MKNARSDFESDREDYVTFGWFDPLLCRRVMRHLSAKRVRFVAQDASGVGIGGAELPKWFKPSPTPYPTLRRMSGIELLIHRADVDKARIIIDET